MPDAKTGQKVAIITGAGGAIGRAIAVELTRAGWNTVLVGRTESTLRETAHLLSSSAGIPSLSPSPGRPEEGRGGGSEIQNPKSNVQIPNSPHPNPPPEYQGREKRQRPPEYQGRGQVGTALVLPADVSRSDVTQSIIDAAVARFGRIDALINNAGFAPVLTIERMTPEIWRQVIETNLSSAFYLCRAAWPVFKKQGGGVIVNISSRAARDPFNGLTAYGAAKAGLNTFGLSLAREGAAIGVRVHTIGLGAVETPMLRNIVSKEQFPSENTLDPADVAQVVADCLGPQGALRYTSGEVIWISRQP